MTNSRSRASRSNGWLGALAALVVLLACTGLASAGRKRVVVLEFEGDGAAKIQQGVVALLKKSHTVISAEKWDDAASELSAKTLSEKNVKKVAKKLKIDGIVSGQVEKRRGDYIIRIKLRAGTSGEIVGDQINVKSSSAKLDDNAQSDLADELVAPVGALATNRGGSGGGGDDEEAEEAEKPVKKVKPGKKPAADEDEEEAEEEEEEPVKPAKKKPAAADEEAEEEEPEFEDSKPKKGFSRRKADEEKQVAKKKPAADEEEEAEEEEATPPKKKRPAKRDDNEDEEEEVASRDEDEDSPAELEASEEDEDEPRKVNPKALTPQERAVDAVAGLSFNMRRLGFNFTPAVVTQPNGYKSIPLPGVMLDATIFPGAIGHKRGGIAENIGATVMFDRVLLISSKDLEGNKLSTTQQRFAIGLVARYPLKSMTIGAALKYGKQSFTIDGESPVPSTAYTVIHPSVFLRYPLSPKMLLNVSAGALAVTGTGEIQEEAQYGGASVFGIQFAASADYLVKPNIFVRGGLDISTYGYTFAGNGMRTMAMDGTQAVAGARDTYIGLAANLGYLY